MPARGDFTVTIYDEHHISVVDNRHDKTPKMMAGGMIHLDDIFEDMMIDVRGAWIIKSVHRTKDGWTLAKCER